MSVLRDGLCKLGFDIEGGKTTAAKLKRPVFFGEDGEASRQYEIDGFHALLTAVIASHAVIVQRAGSLGRPDEGVAITA